MNKIIGLFLLLVSTPVFADIKDFSDGPLIADYGKNAALESDIDLDSQQKFYVAFDVGKPGDSDSVNRGFDTLARFLNMHVRAGVKAENIHLALVVHGKAANDLLHDKAYAAKFNAQNPNTDLLHELLKNQVNIYLCGQTAAYYNIKKTDLHQGIQMALSAMTAHALLQQKGYTLNPF
ncbi:MAG: DsrE family protein [Gammaproteobacteria bacterium]|nr:DsrE family protein [Gammaproteobacteria bacterium]NNC97751.1 DsrE family protein [Gammaproteobacteria bacterium]NNM13260.1 DsrE family protein [Gammaproteobacteria bacterium]